MCSPPTADTPSLRRDETGRQNQGDRNGRNWKITEEKSGESLRSMLIHTLPWSRRVKVTVVSYFRVRVVNFVMLYSH